MNKLTFGLLVLILLAAIALNVKAAGNFPPESCLDRINNDPPGGDPKVDCADRLNGGTGALTCPAGQFHPDPCPSGMPPYCAPGMDDYDGRYKAGWVCPQAPPAEIGDGQVYDEYVPTYEPEPYYGEHGGEEYVFCGDGICSYGEYCFSDCGYLYGEYDYNYGIGYDYGGYYGYDYCYVNAPYYAYPGELTPIEVSYYGFAPYSVAIDCGDGGTATAYRNGYYGYSGAGYSVLYGYCKYTYDGIFFPRAYAGGVVCAGGQVNVEGSSYNDGYDPYYPTYTPTYTPYYPTPTPSPKSPACALTAFPGAVQEGDSSIVSVSYYDLSRPPNAIAVDCGNGITKNAVECLGTTGSCSVFCNYEEAGTFTAIASAAGVACSPVSVKVNPQTSEKCSDGTAFGTCSANLPKYCDEGLLIDKAGICGCPADKVKSGERCIVPAGTCSITLNPSIVRANEQSNVLVNYDGISLQDGKAEVVCGNGRTEIASCSPASELRGTCIASCAYGEEGAYPKTYSVKAFVKGVQCSSANLQVNPPSESTGTLLAKVSDCETGEMLQHAKISIENQPDLFTDANGQLKVSLEPATYNLQVSKAEYLPASASVQVQKGKISTANVCLKPEGCDVSAVLVRTPAADDSRSPLLFQIKITNNANAENDVQISYSSALFISGPTSLHLQGKESQTISIYVFASGERVGRSFGTVSIRGLGECAKNIDLPINVVGGLSIELQQPLKETFGGKNVCFDFLVRNRGQNEGTVTMSYSGDLQADFNVQQFFLASQEIRDGLQFCVDVPSGETGSHIFNLRALSGISDASALATVKVLDAGDFGTDVGGSCILIRDAGELYPITVRNDVAGGDYAVTLRDNDVNAQVSPSVLYNFRKGTDRTIYVSASPKNFDSVDEIVQLLLRKDSQVAMQQELCLTTSRARRREIYTQLSQNVLNLQRGGSVSTVLTIRNMGTLGDDYFIRVESPLAVSIPEGSFYLAPNEEKQITIKFSAASDAARKTYSIPVKIYSGRGTGGVVYDGGHYGSGNAFIKCGNGKTAELRCEEGSSSCSATCNYDDAGSYTIEANVGNQQCQYNSIRVVPDNIASCAVSTESFTREDESVNVKIKYNNLAYEPTDEEILIYCGNGNTVTAEGCDGRTGTCTASCYYSYSGSFTVGATAGGLGCTSANIKVGTDSSYCSISSPALIREDESATISLKYRNAYFGGQYYDYDYRSGSYYTGSGNLLKTETVIVKVDGGGETATLVPSNLNPDAIEVKRVIAADLPSTGRGNVAIMLRNTRDYGLDEIILLMESLPAGVSLVQPRAFELEALSERTIYFQLQAAGAKEGVYKPKVKLRFDSQSVGEEMELRIVPESEILKVELQLQETRYSIEDGRGFAELQFSVLNREANAVRISAVLLQLPGNWSVQAEPALVALQPGGSANFSMNVTAENYEQRSYPAMLEMRSDDGRRFAYPVVLEFQRLNFLSGLFAFAGSLGGVQIFILIVLLAIGLYVYYSRKKAEGEMAGEEETGGTGGGLMHEGLKGIEEEIGGSEEEEIFPKKAKKPTVQLDESRYRKRGAFETTEEFGMGRERPPDFIEMGDETETDEGKGSWDADSGWVPAGKKKGWLDEEGERGRGKREKRDEAETENDLEGAFTGEDEEEKPKRRKRGKPFVEDEEE